MADVPSSSVEMTEETPEADDAHAREVLEAARTEALRAEQAAVKVIETAMIARLAGDANRSETDKARAVMASAVQVANKASEIAKRAVKEAEDAAAVAQAARAEVTRASALMAETEEEVSARKKAKNTVAEETAALELELKAAKSANQAADKEGVVLASKAREVMTHVKYATRTAEKAQTQSTESEAAAHAAVIAIAKAEKLLAVRQEEATVFSNEAFPKQTAVEDLSEAVDIAERAASEYVGTGTTWEIRTQETLRERTREYMRAQADFQKAKKAEEVAEAAVAEATKMLDRANRDHATAVKQAERDKVLAEEAVQALTEQTKLGNEANEAAEAAKKESLEALAKENAMAEKLKNLKVTASAAAVQSAEDEAAAAKETKAGSERHLTKVLATASMAQEAMVRAVASKDSAIAAMEAKQVLTSKALEKENEAEIKKQHADQLVAELQEKVQVLAEASLAERGLEMTPEEVSAAEQDARVREAAAVRDIRALTKTANPDKITAVDKWRAFRQWAEEGQHGVELWNVRKLFYALDGTILSSLDRMVKDIVGNKLDRGYVSAKRSQIFGDGLTQAPLGHVASFQVVAFSSHGLRMDKGGDTITVGIRYNGVAMTIRSKVVDNGDGSYLITFKPSFAGKCTISVALTGEPLPGSPFACTVSAPTPCASQCILHGEALTNAIAHNKERFFCSFRDAFGQVAHAAELDIWVHPIGIEKAQASQLAIKSKLPADIARLLEPLGEFDLISVGANPLDVTLSRDPESEVMGRLQPGRLLQIVQVEPPLEEGLLRACIIYEVEEPELKVDTPDWRELWPQWQEWRTPTAYRARSRGQSGAMTAVLTRQAEETKAATLIGAAYRGKNDRRLTARLLHDKRTKAKTAALAAKTALEEAGGASAPSAKGGDASRTKGKARPAKSEAQSPEKGPTLKTTKAKPNKAKVQGSDRAGGHAQVETPKAKSKGKAASSSRKASDTKTSDAKASDAKACDAKAKAEAAKAAEEAKAAELMKAEEERHMAAIRIQSTSRGILARGKAKEMTAVAGQASNKGKYKVETPTRKGFKSKSSKGSKAAERSARKRQTVTKEGGTTSQLDPAAETSKQATTPAEKASLGRSLGSLRKDPEVVYGWITLAIKDEPLVMRQMGRLPAHVRQQQLQQWFRRMAIDSDRERERAREREASEILTNTSESFRPTLFTGYANKRTSPTPRMPYLNDLETDPKGIGFAYGGVYPGKLHAKGQLIETHEVLYSVGVSGTYLMYVSLRQPNSQQHAGLENVPGSPFYLEVAPGCAHPLATQIPAASLPLRGGRTKDAEDGKRFACELLIPSCDKMGNRCTSGGADIACGFLDALHREPPTATGADDEDRSQEFEGPRSICTDMGNGSYLCKWFSPTPGEFDVFIKIDGLHVHGSPTLMQLTQPRA